MFPPTTKTLSARLLGCLSVLLLLWLGLGIVIIIQLDPAILATLLTYLAYATIIIMAMCSIQAHSRRGLLFYIVFEVILTAFGIVIVLVLLTTSSRPQPLVLLRNSSSPITTPTAPPPPPPPPDTTTTLIMMLLIGLHIMKIMCLTLSFRLRRAMRALNASKKRNNENDVELDSSTSATAYYVNIEPALFTAQPVYPTSGFQYP